MVPWVTSEPVIAIEVSLLLLHVMWRVWEVGDMLYVMCENGLQTLGEGGVAGSLVLGLCASPCLARWFSTPIVVIGSFVDPFFRVVWSPCRGRMVILWWINVDARRSIAVLVNSQLSPLVLYDSLLSILLLRSACLIGRIAYFDIGRPWSHIKYVNSF
jgi:hypothetical protein